MMGQNHSHTECIMEFAAVFNIKVAEHDLRPQSKSFLHILKDKSIKCGLINQGDVMIRMFNYFSLKQLTYFFENTQRKHTNSIQHPLTHHKNYRLKHHDSDRDRLSVSPAPLQTSFLHISLVISRSESGPFICQQGHQSLCNHEVGRGDEFVLLSHATQKAGQELPLDGVVHCGQIHAGSCRDQVLGGKNTRQGGCILIHD